MDNNGVNNNIEKEVSNNQSNNSLGNRVLNNYGKLSDNNVTNNLSLNTSNEQSSINDLKTNSLNQSTQVEDFETIFGNNTSVNNVQQTNNVIEKPVVEPIVSSGQTNDIVTSKSEDKKNVEVKQKKSKGPVVIIIILLLIVLGLAGYIVYDKFLSKDTNEPDTKEEETTLKEVKDKALIEELRSGLVAVDANGLVKGLYHNYKITSSDANDKELLIFNILKYVEENKINIHETKSTIDTGVQQDIKATISKADITTYMQNKYNTNLDYAYKASKQYDNVGAIGYLAVLADDTNYYIASIPGGDGSYYLNTKLVKTEEDENNIYIYDTAVYSIFALDIRRSFDSLDIKDYLDNEKQEYIPDKILIECLGDNTTADPNDIKKSDKCPFTGNISDITPDSMSKYAFENMSKKLKTYKHTFKKLDGNYFWVSSEVVE